MRRDVRILLTTAILGAIATWGPELGSAVGRMDTFRVDLGGVEIRGTRYLDRETVVGLLGLSPQTSVWTDTDVWEDRVASHPLVREARVTRLLPSGLMVEVSERIPIAFAPTPALEPIDAEGYRLPLDPAVHRLDLPVLWTDRIPPQGARLVPEEVRRLAREVVQLMTADTAFLQRVSSVSWTDRGSMLVTWSEPPVDFLLPPGTPPSRLREGIVALQDAASRSTDGPPVAVDLRFEDQVVVRQVRGGV